MKGYDEPVRTAFDIGFGETWPDATIMETGRSPASTYNSPEQFAIEREVFGKVWLFAGREVEVAKPGDWIVREVEVRGVSVIITRDRAGKLNAFHNVCAHRGMRIMWEQRGHGPLIVCPYHAWSFSHDGALKAVPDEQAFPGLCKEDKGLVRVSIDSWRGFLFINLDPEPAQTLQAFLGPIADMLDGARFDDFPCWAVMTQVVPVNWKLGNEAAQEGYHVGTLHYDSARPWGIPPSNPFGHFLGWQPVGPHRISSVPGNPEFRIDERKPIQAFAFKYAAQTTVAGTGEEHVDGAAGFGDHPDLNPLKAEDWASDQFALFPFGIIAASRNGWWYNAYAPVTVDTARWESRLYYKAPTLRREIFALHCTLAQTRDVLTEDNFSVRGQHEGLKTGVLKEVTFGGGEMIPRHMAAVMKGIVDNWDRSSDPFRLAAE